MKIILYQNYAEQELLDKRSQLLVIIELDGTFRDEVNLISPSIRVQTDLTTINKCNYVSIPDLERYYYMVDKTIVRAKDGSLICDLDLEEDVTTTYVNEINELKVILARQEFDYNDLLIDEKLPATTRSKVTYYKPTCKHFTKNGGEYCYILNTTAPPVIDTSITSQHVPNPLDIYSDSYIFTQDQLELFANKLLSDNIDLINKVSFLFNNPSEALISTLYVPFNLDTDVEGITTAARNSIVVGKGSVQLTPCKQIVSGDKIIYKPCTPFTIPHTHTLRSFLNYSPYTSIEIFLPFYGFLTVDTNLVIDREIDIEYHIDVISGECKIILRDFLTYDILYTVPCVFGAKIDLATSNISDKIRNQTQYAIEFFANVFSLGSSYAVSQMSAPKKYTPVKKNITKKYAKWEKKNTLENNERLANTASKSTCDLIDTLQNHISSGISSPSVIEWSVFTVEDNDEYSFNVFVKVTTVDDINVDDYAKFIGRPSIANDYIKNFTGYTEVNSVHLDTFNSATIDELDNIDIILRSGIIINHPILANKPIVIDNLGNSINYTLVDYNTMNPDKNNITIFGVTQYIDYSKNIVYIKIKLSYNPYINFTVIDSNFDITNLSGYFDDSGADFYLYITCNIKPKTGLSPSAFTPTITVIKN